MKSTQTHIDELIILLSPLLIVLAHFLRVKKEIIEFVIIPTAVLLNLFLFLRSNYKSDDQEIRLFETFLTGEFCPIRLGGPLLLSAEILVIEAEFYKEAFCKSLEKEFPVGVANRELIFKPFKWNEFKEKDQRYGLRGLLRNAKAVIVVRTKELEENAWVYAEVEAWANKRPEAPCLYVKEIDDADCKSELPKNYYWMANDPKATPWQLLQRTKARGSAWRSQADFNRMMARHIGILLSVSMTIGLFVWFQQRDELQTTRMLSDATLKTEQGQSKSSLEKKEQEYRRKLKELYLAVRTKEDFENLTQTNEDPKLNVSYWFRHAGKIKQVITTENAAFHKSFDDDRGSAIGCGFFYGDMITEWDEKKDPSKVSIFGIDNSEKSDPECKMKPEDDRKITSIVCDSYNQQTKIPEYTVGVCVFTETPTSNIFKNRYRQLLRDKAKDFYEYAVPLIKSDELRPFVDEKP